MIPNKKITISPDLIFKRINEFLDNKYNDIVCDQYEERRNNNLSFFNNFKNDLLEMIKSNNFWKYSMNISYCDHKYKNGRICDKRIYIKPKTKEFKCAKHISRLVYLPEKKGDILKELCVSFNNKGGVCKKQKIYGDFCNYHYSKYNQYLHNIKTDIYYILLYDIDIEIDLFNKIYIDDDFLYENKKNIVIDFNKKVEFVDIIKNVNKPICQLNDCLGILNPTNRDLKKYLDGGIKLYNNKEYLKDIAVYDIHNGKKINVRKLIDKYKKMEKLKIYIDNNKKFLYLKNNNKNREFYINEKYINILLEYINTRYSDLYSTLYESDTDCWLYLLNEYKMDIDSIICDFHNIDIKHKIYI